MRHGLTLTLALATCTAAVLADASSAAALCVPTGGSHWVTPVGMCS